MSKSLFAPALLMAALATPALANEPDETISVHVRTSDLDLAVPAGQRRLARRINAAIGDICRAPRLDLRLERRAAECRARARARTEPDVRLAIARAKLGKARLVATAKTPPA